MKKELEYLEPLFDHVIDIATDINERENSILSANTDPVEKIEDLIFYNSLMNKVIEIPRLAYLLSNESAK